MIFGNKRDCSFYIGNDYGLMLFFISPTMQNWCLVSVIVFVGMIFGNRFYFFYFFARLSLTGFSKCGANFCIFLKGAIDLVTAENQKKPKQLYKSLDHVSSSDPI